MVSMVDWDKIRACFPVVKTVVYLNVAGGGPMPYSVGEESKKYFDEFVNKGDVAWDEWLDGIEEVRKKTAAFLNCTNSEIAFLTSASQTISYLALMFKGQGDVITFDDEFSTSTLPWVNLDYKVNFVKPNERNEYTAEIIEKNITESTRFLVISHVTSHTGFRADLQELAELCTRKNLIFIINATQSAGAFSIDVSEIQPDFLVFQGYKWMLSGYGIAALYVNKKYLGKIKPPVAGSNILDHQGLDNRLVHIPNEATALEVGAPHFPTIFTLGASIDFLTQIGVENIQNRIFELNDYFEEQLKKLNVEILSPLDKKYRSGITIIKDNNGPQLAEELLKENIFITGKKQFIRISLYFYNNFEDIDKFIAAYKSTKSL